MILSNNTPIVILKICIFSLNEISRLSTEYTVLVAVKNINLIKFRLIFFLIVIFYIDKTLPLKYFQCYNKLFHISLWDFDLNTTPIFLHISMIYSKTSALELLLADETTPEFR